MRREPRSLVVVVAFVLVSLGEGKARAAPRPAPPPRPPVPAMPAPKTRAAAPPKTRAAAPPKPELPKAVVLPALARARREATTGLAAPQAIQEFPKDREVALAAVTTTEDTFRHVAPQLRHDKAFLRAAVLANPHLLMPETQDTYTRAALEAVLPASVREELLTDPAVAAAVNAHRARLATVPDLQPSIFPNRRFLAEVIANRTGPRDGDDRPVAVVAYPIEDWNGQFFGRMDLLEDLTKRYRVMFYQVETDAAFVSALADGAKEKPADLVVIGGHGESALTAFGADDPAKLPEKARAQLASPTTSPRTRQRILDRLARLTEERYLDLSDGKQLETVKDRIAPGGSLVLISCSTGRGGAKATNLANFLHEVFPQARIDAPTEPVPNMGLKLDARGLYEDAGFADMGKRYRIPPK